MEHNVCKFSTTSSSEAASSLSIDVLSFIYEKNIEKRRTGFHLLSAFAAYLVTSGTGSLRTLGGEYPIQVGDLFFTFPAKSFSIESAGTDEKLEYISITFLGLGVLPLLQRLGVNEISPVYHNLDSLIGFWKESLDNCDTHNVDLMAKGVLFCTLSRLDRSTDHVANTAEKDDVILKIKNDVDTRYFDSELSLERLCEQYNYNLKYISGLFKKRIGIGFSKYLQSVRIQHACALMQEGILASKDIAYLVGYKDPLYFSRVFKKIMSYSPRSHLEELQEQKTE